MGEVKIKSLNSMRRNYYIILLLVIVLVAGGVFFFLRTQPLEIEKGGQEISPTTTTPIKEIDTSDWLIYRSEKFGYEIDYPQGADFHERDKGERFGINLEKYLNIPEDLRQARDEAICGPFFSLGVSISIEGKEQFLEGMKTEIENPENLPIRDFMYEYTETSQAPYPDFDEDITFAGMPAYYMEVYDSGCGGLYQHIKYSISFFRNGKLFWIRGIKLPTEPSYVWENNPSYNYFQKYISIWENHPFYSYFQQYIPISEAIIQSFKFIE